MIRKTASFPIKNIPQFKQQMLNWANRFNICCFLDNHEYFSAFQTVECLAAAGSVNTFSPKTGIFSELKRFCADNRDWLFGHLAYDLKNELAPLQSTHPDHIGFPDIFFFRPETVVQLQQNTCTIESLTKNPDSILQEILQCHPQPSESYDIRMQARMSKEEYLEAIQKILGHIQRGDCYEINYCQEFYSEEISINPLPLYNRLTELSPAPFASFYKLNSKYLLCASPERFLQKKGTRLLSQPIKGTYKRNTGDPIADESLKQALLNSRKERSENVMIVDLVRNDLSRICREGSVQVDELFGIYSFPQVHQMISTISGEICNDLNFADIIKATFPMGSMTGAPKRSVMELTEKYEKTKRGIYSGAVGYITPGNDFDFNVVIRSILYNAENRYLSYLTGGGITFQSDPEQEYEECLLKAAAMKQVLKGLMN